MSGYVDFEFDLPEALLVSLIEVLDRLEAAPLNPDNLRHVPEEQGVYQLLLDDRIVYIGKTDARAGLYRRLFRHSKKILFRQGLDPARVSFKAVRVYVFTAVDLESELIRHYGGVRNIAWNGSGFGSNDPGQRRDMTRIRPTNFDAQYPVDLDRPLAFAISANETAGEALARLKDALPFNLRFENGTSGPHDDMSTTLSEAKGPMTTREAITRIVSALPPGWQATGLPGYVILYKERRTFPAGAVIAVS